MTVVLVTPSRFPDLAVERAVLEPSGAALNQAVSVDELMAEAPHADALLVTGGRVTAKLVERLARCRFIVRCGVGTDNIDVAAATLAGIPVGFVPDASVGEVADHAVALALMSLRRVGEASALLARGEWAHDAVRGVRRIAGLTAGIVGVGRIGLAVADRLRALGMDVIGYDEQQVSRGDVPLVGLDELLRRADVVSLHLPLSDDTRGIISAERLALLKPTSVLINVARGGLVDESALADMLGRGALWGAGIDVFAEEPLDPGSPLRTAPHAVLTPHVAWYSDDAVVELRHKAAEQVARGLRGERLAPTINPGVYELEHNRLRPAEAA
jgi:D-3-phosphoglycerate dehydrogenase / 2-oxoglutarate reductase